MEWIAAWLLIIALTGHRPKKLGDSSARTIAELQERIEDLESEQVRLATALSKIARWWDFEKGVLSKRTIYERMGDGKTLSAYAQRVLNGEDP